MFRFPISEFYAAGKTACYNGYRNFSVETGKALTMALQSGAEAELLLHWYQENKRSLPWRDTGNPEDVWISEIMLQQTRVEAVKDYFVRFRTALPTVAAIAACPDEQLLRLWEGLGYYTRARNIKKCAQVLLRDYGGELPVDPLELKKLPGIGPYTAGAIASIAYNVPVPAVDGNVLRVFSRLTACADDIMEPAVKQAFTERLQDLLWQLVYTDRKTFPVADFNQALMELGALICIPNGAPNCERCPLAAQCDAHRLGIETELPHRAPKKPRRVEVRTVLVLRDGERFYVQQRPSKGLLAGMYEFPGLPGALSEEEVLQAVDARGFTPLRILSLPAFQHVFTHIEWHMSAFEVQIAEPLSAVSAHRNRKENAREGIFVTRTELEKLALPSAFRPLLARYALRPPRKKKI